MGNRDTVEWIKNQMKEGYKRDELKNILIDNGYETEYAERLIKDAENGECHSIEKKDDHKPHNETKDENKKYSWIKTGSYAGISLLIAMILIVFNSVFFDNYEYAPYVTTTVYMLAEATLVANRARGYSFSKISGAIIVARTVFTIGMFFTYLMFFSYMMGAGISEINNHKGEVIRLYANAISIEVVIYAAVMFIFSLIISGGLACLARKIMVKKSIGEFKILKPILLIAVINIAVVLMYSMTGPRIDLEPVDVSWCENCENDFIQQERTYDMGCEGVTGYNTESYFEAKPRINNRFETNKYKLATMLISMINTAAIGMNTVATENLADEANLTEQYYDQVIRKTDVDFEIKSKKTEDAIPVIFDSVESLLINQRKFIMENELIYGDEEAFESKEIHIRFIDAKLRINDGLRKRYDMLGMDFGESDMSFIYIADTVAEDVIDNYYRFLEYQTRINIIGANISNTSVKRQLKVDVTIVNHGIREYNISDNKIDISVNREQIYEMTCDFDVICVNQTGKCLGYVEEDKEMQKTIKVSPRSGFGDEFIYPGDESSQLSFEES